MGPRDKVSIPKDAPVVTAAVVTPGLIDAHTTVGLSGGANVPADQDQDEKTDPNQADLRVLDGFNPDEPLLEFIRREGVTVIHAVPGRANVIAGQTGIFRTAGRTAESMTLRFPAGILVNLGEVPKKTHPGKLPTTRMGTAALVRAAFTQAQQPRPQAGRRRWPRQTASGERQAGGAGPGAGEEGARDVRRPSGRRHCHGVAVGAASSIWRRGWSWRRRAI